MEERIKEYLKEKFFIEIGTEVKEDEDLFKNGIINSYGYMDILQFIENEFKIEFNDEDLFSNVLVSYNNIIEFIKGKKNRA